MQPRLSARATLWLSLLCLVLATGYLHREVLFGGAMYHMDDAADNYYPARVAFRRALREGTLPAWERGSFCGWPLLADPYYGFFYPLNFVFYLGPRRGEPPAGDAAGVAFGLGRSAALHMLLGGIGMLLFLRRRLSPAAALLGALSFSLSSFLVVRIRHIIFIQLAAWLPWLLLGIELYLLSRRRAPLVLCSVATAMVFIVGAHSLLHFAVLLLLGYVLGRLIDETQGTPARLRALWQAGAPLLLAALLGSLAAAVALLPTLASMPHTSRALGTDYQFASSYAWPAWRYAQTLLMPDMLGPGETRGAPWLGKWNHWELCGYYQGAAMLLLALLGAFTPAPGRRSRADRLLLLLLGLGAVLTALGDRGPLHPFLFRHLPLYAALRCPSRALFVLVVAVPILGAYGAEWLLGQARPLLGRFDGRWRLGAGVLLAALGLGLALLQAQRLEEHPGEGPRLLWFHLAQAHLIAALGVLLAIVLLRHVAGIVPAAALLLVCAATAADQVPIDRGYLQPRAPDFAYGTERFSAVEWLLGELGRQRAAGQVEDRFTNDPRGPFRLNSSGETFGFENAAGYGSVLVWRYSNFLYILNHGEPYPHRRLRDDLAAATLWQLDSPLVDLLTVRYLLGPERPSGKWIERFHPAPGAPPHAAHEPYWDPRINVYENTQVMPRAFVAYHVERAATERDEAQALSRPDFDPHRLVILGGAAPVPLAADGARPFTPATILVRQRHRMVIDAQADADGVLVLSDAYYPGWSATVDGRPAPILPADLALRAVPLAAGRHRVEMRYRSDPLMWGAALSLTGLLGLLFLGLAPGAWLASGRRTG